MEDRLSASAKKRRRPALACTQCRRRKMRCDQNTPCSNCAKSSRYECVYPADIQAGTFSPRTPSNRPLGGGRPGTQTGKRSRTTTSEDTTVGIERNARFGGAREGRTATGSPPRMDVGALPVEVQSLRERINELESRLAKALQHEGTTQPTSGKSVKQPQPRERRFANQSSWLNDTILHTRVLRCLGKAQQDHPGLRHIMTQSKKLAWSINERLIPAEDPAAPLIVGSRMPLKSTADRLLGAYFTHFGNIFRIIQYPGFVLDSEQYWRNPSAASDVFVLQLQICLALGIVASDKLLHYDSAPSQWLNEARTWIDRSSGGPRKRTCTIQELQLHALMCLAEASLSMSEKACWIDAGSLMRKAMGLGFHRDPDNLGIADPEECKGRRQLWTSIVELNLILSLQAAQPCLITPSDWDGTLLVEEADGESVMVDRARAKTALEYESAGQVDSHLQTFLSISLPLRCRFASRVNSPAQPMSYEEVLQFHTDLTRAHQNLKAKLARRTSDAAPAGTQRQFPQEPLIDAIFSWYLLALHLPLLGSSIRNPSFHFSRRTCVAAAIQILNRAGITGSARPEPPNAQPKATADYSLLFLNSAGLFRGIVMQAIFTVLFELVTESEERQEDTLMFKAWNPDEVHRSALACQDWIESRASNGSPDIPSCCFAAGCIAYAASAPSTQPTSALMDRAMIESGVVACQRYLDKLSEASELSSHIIGADGPPVAPPHDGNDAAAVVDLTDWQMDVNMEGLDDFFAFDWTHASEPIALPAHTTYAHMLS